MTLLDVRGLDAGYGLLQAVRSVDLSVQEGERVALVGANGAGKTTLLRAIAGAHPVDAGQVLLDGADITRTRAHRRVEMGIALVPEGRRLFPDLTVLENLQVAGAHGRPGPWSVDSVVEAFAMLRPLLRQRASTLSGGQQQAAAIARSLMTNPRLLLLDEVSLGLSPIAVQVVYDSLQHLTEQGTTIVLVEQDLARGLAFADRVVCMLEGRLVLEGPVGAFSREQVTEAFFGLHGPAQGRSA